MDGEDSKLGLLPNVVDGGALSSQDQNDPSSPLTVETKFQISSTFGPTGAGSKLSPVDLILFSSDGVVFYVNERTILGKSNNSFKNLLPLASNERSQRTLLLAEIPWPELETMLRAVYDIENDTLPSVIDCDTAIRAIDRLPVYGIQPSVCIIPECQLYRYLLSYAPLRPFEMYAMAAHHNLVPLAVTVSSHTLSLDLSQLHEDLCAKMGSTYLIRLFQLHYTRTEILKKLLMTDLGLHNPIPGCNFEGQKIFKGMWNLAFAEMLPNIRPNTATSEIRTVILSHTANLKCQECIKLRDKCLNHIVSEWVLAPRNVTV